MRQSNPDILLQTWEWTFLKVYNLLGKKQPQFLFTYVHPSENAEAEGGCMVKEQDSEAEKIQIPN